MITLNEILYYADREELLDKWVYYETPDDLGKVLGINCPVNPEEYLNNQQELEGTTINCFWVQDEEALELVADFIPGMGLTVFKDLYWAPTPEIKPKQEPKTKKASRFYHGVV